MNTQPKARACLGDIAVPAYSSLPANIHRMDDNTNLFGSNPAIEKVAREFNYSMLSRYPSVISDDLREAIAVKHNVQPSQVLAGNGSDDVIDMVAKSFIEPGDIAALPVPSYEFYGLFVKLAGARIERCPLIEPGFKLDSDKIISVHPKVAFICSPNNPTGNRFDEGAIRELLEKSGALVVLDEAYVEFSSSGSHLRMIDEYENLLVMRTFSKAYGLAGLRIGYCIGGENVISQMLRARRPFVLNSFSEAVAIEALKSDDFIRKVAETNSAERAWISKRFGELGIKAYASEANFILFKSPIPATQLLERMLEKGIAIRDCSKQPTLKDCMRVTVGSREMNERFVAELAKLAEGCR